MPRKLRVEFPGAIYHVMSRGDRREDIFLDDVDRQDFLKTLAETGQKTGFQVQAYCLMGHHIHWMMATPEANLVAGMRWLLITYNIRLNHRRKLCGHAFSGRYKALLVEGGGGGYRKTVCDDVPLNLVRAKLLGTEDRLLGYRWSSLGWYLAAAEHRPRWIRVDRLLGEHGIGVDTAAGRAQFERRLEERQQQEMDEAECEPLRRGWCLGSEAFRKEMLGRMEGPLGESHAGELRQGSAEVRAEQIVAEELGRFGWSEAQLRERRKSDPAKLALAARLRRETTLTVGWIAHRVAPGNPEECRGETAPLGEGKTKGGAKLGQDYGLTPTCVLRVKMKDSDGQQGREP